MCMINTWIFTYLIVYNLRPRWDSTPLEDAIKFGHEKVADILRNSMTSHPDYDKYKDRVSRKFINREAL